MSVWSEIKSAMRPAKVTAREFKALRYSFEKSIASQQIPAEGVRIEAPGVSHAGKPYLLVFILDRTGRIIRFEADHDPDLSAPCFDAYTDFMAKIEAEKKAETEPASSNQGEGDRG